MNIAPPYYQLPGSVSRQTLVGGLVLSIALHLMTLLFWPQHKSDARYQIPDIVSMELLQPQQATPAATPSEPEPVPALVPEPKPVPPKAKPIPQIKPTPRPAPKPVTTPQPVPQPVPAEPPVAYEASPVLAEPSASAATAPPTSEPATDSNPAPVAVTPPPPPSGPSPLDIDAARRQYADQLARAIARHKQYPNLARMRNWEGEVLIDLKLDNHGNVLSSSIGHSSGFDILDRQALEMVRKASPFPTPPEALRHNHFNIQVPVSFKLE